MTEMPKGVTEDGICAARPERADGEMAGGGGRSGGAGPDRGGGNTLRNQTWRCLHSPVNAPETRLVGVTRATSVG